MVEDGAWYWLKPEKLIKTQADDRFNTVLDFIFIANPPDGISGKSTILARAGDAPAEAEEFEDSREETDHRPVDAVFTIITERREEDRLVSNDEQYSDGFDRTAVLERIRELQGDLAALEAMVSGR